MHGTQHGTQHSTKHGTKHRAFVHMLCGVLWMCACSKEEISVQEQKQQALDAAWQENILASAENTPVVSLPQKEITDADIQSISVVFAWENIGQVHKGFFTDPDAVDVLRRGLAQDMVKWENPIVVNIRWLEDEKHMGVGEIALVYDRALPTMEQAQYAADTLVAYRNFVGSNFDMRLLSFSLLLEGNTWELCRLPVLYRVGMSNALVSPCVERKGTSVCLEKDQNKKPIISAEMRRTLDICFTP